MQRLYPGEYTFSDILVAAVLACLGSGAVLLVLNGWLGLNHAFELGATVVIELGAIVFALILILLFVSMVVSRLTRLFDERV